MVMQIITIKYYYSAIIDNYYSTIIDNCYIIILNYHSYSNQPNYSLEDDEKP